MRLAEGDGLEMGRIEERDQPWLHIRAGGHYSMHVVQSIIPGTGTAHRWSSYSTLSIDIQVFEGYGYCMF